MEEIKKGLEKVFGKGYVKNDEEEFLIYVPEITIHDDLENSRILRGLFLNFTLMKIKTQYQDDLEEELKMMFLKLARHVFTPEEVLVKYIHSHVNRDSGFSFMTFCMGKTIQPKMTFDEEGAIMLGLWLKELLSYESTEGGAYIPLQSISKEVNSTQMGNYDHTVNPDEEFMLLLEPFVNIHKTRTTIEFKLTEKNVVLISGLQERKDFTFEYGKFYTNTTKRKVESLYRNFSNVRNGKTFSNGLVSKYFPRFKQVYRIVPSEITEVTKTGIPCTSPRFIEKILEHFNHKIKKYAIEPKFICSED